MKKRSKKTKSKKTKTKATADKKRATKKGKKKGKKAEPPEDPGVPVWGPKIVIGSVLGADITVQEPLNQAALDQTTSMGGLTIIFHQRLSTLETQVEGLLRDLDLHQRIARLEAQAEED